MISHDYAEGVTAGFAQGAASTAERIRNALVAILAEGSQLGSEKPAPLWERVAALAADITRDYGLE